MGEQDVRSLKRDGNVLRAAGVMGVAVMISRIFGLVREQVFAYFFGAGHAMDAYNIAFRIPNLFRNLFAEGAMSAAFVPTFVRVREEEGDRRAWRVAGLVFRVLAVGGMLLAFAGLFLSEPFAALLAGPYREVGGKFELTVLLSQIMFFFMPLVALAAAYMGLLNSCGLFFLPALSSALFNVFSVAAGVALTFLMPRFGWHPIAGMAFGVVIGGVVQAFCQWPAVKGVGYRWHGRDSKDPPWHRERAMKRMLILMGPATLGLAAVQINSIVNSVLAAGAGAGAVSWLGYAFRLMQFPIGIFSVSLATAILPEVSRLWVRKDLDGIRRSLDQTLRHVLAINMPAAAGLAFLAAPIVALVFEHGSFTADDTRNTAMALAAYSAGLAFYSVVKILVGVFYGMGNTRVPVVSSVVSIVANLVLNLALSKPLGFWGLALGTSLAALVNSAYLLFAVRSELRKGGGDFSPWGLLGSFFVHGMVACTMGLVCWGSHEALATWLPETLFTAEIGRFSTILIRLFRVGVIVAEGVGVVWILSMLFRIRESQEVIHLVGSKLTRKLRRRRETHDVHQS